MVGTNNARSHDRRFVVYISYYYNYCKTYSNKY